MFYDTSNWWNNKMKCPKCDNENSIEDSVKQVAECPYDCHKETHSF